MPDHPDIKIPVARTVKGDSEAFGEIVRTYQGMVALMVGRYARIEADREDLAQEVFIRAFGAIKNFRGSGSFEGWLRKVAVFTCLDWLRKKKREASLSLSELNSEQREWIEKNLVASEPPGKNREFNSAATLEILQKAMESLSPEDHLVIVLKELEDKSISEISQITGWSATNVKVRAHRARERLKTIILSRTRENSNGG